MFATTPCRYRRFFGEAKKQQRKFALWQAICLEETCLCLTASACLHQVHGSALCLSLQERNRETRDIDGVRQARSVLYKVFQEHAKEMGVAPCPALLVRQSLMSMFMLLDESMGEHVLLPCHATQTVNMQTDAFSAFFQRGVDHKSR